MTVLSVPLLILHGLLSVATAASEPSVALTNLEANCDKSGCTVEVSVKNNGKTPATFVVHGYSAFKPGSMGEDVTKVKYLKAGWQTKGFVQ